MLDVTERRVRQLAEAGICPAGRGDRRALDFRPGRRRGPQGKYRRCVVITGKEAAKSPRNTA